jgi:hypothetical protein
MSTFDDVQDAVRKSIEALFYNDGILLAINASEQSICHRLARHIENSFAQWDVDCEYNRDGHDYPKLVNDLRSLIFDLDDSVFPDIVVHKRTLPGGQNNLLVVEVKKTTNGTNDHIDKEKLRIFTFDFHRRQMNYHYQFGLTLRFKAWKLMPSASVLCARGIWYREGDPSGEPLVVKRNFVTETTKDGQKVLRIID